MPHVPLIPVGRIVMTWTWSFSCDLNIKIYLKCVRLCSGFFLVLLGFILKFQSDIPASDMQFRENLFSSSSISRNIFNCGDTVLNGKTRCANHNIFVNSMAVDIIGLICYVCQISDPSVRRSSIYKRVKKLRQRLIITNS